MYRYCDDYIGRHRLAGGVAADYEGSGRNSYSSLVTCTVIVLVPGTGRLRRADVPVVRFVRTVVATTSYYRYN
jgi:hypothetical protein